MQTQPAISVPPPSQVNIASISQATNSVLQAFQRAHERMHRITATASVLFGDKLKTA